MDKSHSWSPKENQPDQPGAPPCSSSPCRSFSKGGQDPRASLHQSELSQDPEPDVPRTSRDFTSFPFPNLPQHSQPQLQKVNSLAQQASWVSEHSGGNRNPITGSAVMDSFKKIRFQLFHSHFHLSNTDLPVAIFMVEASFQSIGPPLPPPFSLSPLAHQDCVPSHPASFFP